MSRIVLWIIAIIAIIGLMSIILYAIIRSATDSLHGWEEEPDAVEYENQLRGNKTWID